jgi:hypothetical protein
MAMGKRIVIDGCYCGPAGTGNGGYVGGLLANHLNLGGGVEATFRRPIPLGRELQLERDAARAIRLFDKEDLIAEASPSSVTLSIPRPPTLAEAEDATRRHIGLRIKTPFCKCFGCGVDRDAGAGLRIFAGPTRREDGLYAAVWVPETPFADKVGLVRPEFVWTAADCSAGFALMGTDVRVLLTARLAVDIRERPRVKEPCIVAAWVVQRGGRKNVCATALFGTNGRLCALARSLWIDVME